MIEIFRRAMDISKIQNLMRKWVMVAALIIFVFIAATATATTYYGRNGTAPNTRTDWGTTSGGGGTNPANFTTAGDVFIIENGTTMTATAAWTVGSATATTTTSTLQINSGGTLAMSTRLLTLASCNLINSGTYSGSGGVTISGTGTAISIGGINTTGAITISKTTGTITLTSSANGASLTFPTTQTANVTLSLNSGVALNLTGAVTMGRPTAAGSILNVGAGLLSCGSITMSATTGTVGITEIQISTGAVTVTGSGITSAGVASQIVFSDAGTLNDAGTFMSGTAGTYTCSTGTVNFNGAAQTIAPFAYTFNNVTLSGSGAKALTNATIGGNLVLSSGSSVTVTTAAALTVGGNLTIGDGTTLTAGASALTVAGTTTVGNGVSGVLSITNATGTKTFAGAVSINSGGAITETAAAALAFGSDVNISGTLTESGAAAVSVAGNWTNNGSFNTGSSTTTFNGTNGQTIGGTSVSTFNNLIINNASGVSLSAPVSVSGILTLTSGTITTSSTNLLTITNTGSITGASSASYIVGSLAMTLPASVGTDGTSYSFPVGETGNYCPLNLVNIRTGATSPVVQVTENASGALTVDGTTMASAYPRNWYVQTTSGNFTSATIQLTQSSLIPTNVIGKSTAQSGNYVSIGGTNIGASITSAQTVSSFPAYFAVGTSLIRALYSYQSGSWDNSTTWTTDPSGTTSKNARVPGTSDSVIILNGRTISITSNNKNVESLTLIAGGVLNISSTTGHNFGVVAGQGKLMLSSGNFPNGTFTSFVASNGGTVEYYNLSNAPLSTTQFTYNNLIVSDSTATNSAYLSNPSNPTTYIINGNFSLKNYSGGSQTFYFGNPTASDNLINMFVYGNFLVDAGCNIRVNNFATSHNIPNDSTTEGGTTYPVHTLNLYGNFTNNGSVRFTGLPSPLNTAYYTLTTTSYNPGTGTVNYGDVQVYFYGATNNTVTCNGTTDFFRLIVAKGSDDTYTLEVSSTNTNNFALYAPNNQGLNAFNDGHANGYGYGAYYKALFIHYGTLKLDANISIPSLTEGGQDFNIIPTAELWINGANVSTTVSGLNGTGYQAATVYGDLRISAGQFSTGDAAGIVLGTLGTPTVTIEGTGVLDVSQAWTATGGSNLMSYVQTGGTANFRLQGENHAGPAFGLSTTNSSFVMSGGTINFSNDSLIGGGTDSQIMDIECPTGFYQVTGGTINLNLPSSATTYTANSTVPFYNFNITNRTGSGTTAIQWNTPGASLNVLNSLTIGGNTVLNLNTSSISLNVGGNFTISSGGAYTPGTADTTTFNGSGYQAFTNAGTITGGALSSLSIINSSRTTIVSNNVFVNGSLTIGQNAALNDSGKYVYAYGNIVNAGTHTGLSSGGGIRLKGVAAQSISGNGKYFNLIIDKSSASNVSLLSNIMVSGALRLVTNANLNIGSYNLTLDSLANIYTDSLTSVNYDSVHMIVTNGLASDGGVTKKFCSASPTFLYPFGTGTKYHPATIQFTANPAQYGSITVRPVSSADPMLQPAGRAINYYWKVTSSNFSGIQNNSINQTYGFYPADAQNLSDTSSYVPATYIAPAWTINAAGTIVHSSLPRRIQFNSINYLDGEYTCGTTAAFGSVPTLYSIASGAWNNINTWSTTRGGSHGTTFPHATTAVYITTGNTVTATPSDSSGNLVIESGATLDLQATTGHSFGTITNNATTGSGTVRLASNNYYPKGDWGSFLGSNGGTVEYYLTATGTLSMPTSYTLPAGGTANITSYCNLITSPYNNSNIILPNTNLTIYNNFTVGYSTGGGTSSCVTQVNAGATTTTLEVRGVITINQYGVLQCMNAAAQNVLADSDLTIAAGGALQVRNGGTANLANTLTVDGNIINNGTLDLDANYPTNDNYHCTLVFSGSSSKALTNTTTPTRTRFYAITVDKGTTLDSIVTVSINPTGFQMGNGGLSIQNGTFRLTSPVTMALSSGGFTIPVTGGLSANGGTFNIVTGTTSADLTLKGRLEILSGTVNIGPGISSGSTISSSIVYTAAASPTISISGGVLNVFSQVRRDTANNSGSLNYTQVGGTVTIGGKNASAGRAVFEVMNGGSNFVMGNGTLIIASGSINTTSPYDMDIEPDVSNVTGGTIQFGLSGVTANPPFRFETSVPLWNLTLDSLTNSSAIQEIYNSTLLGSLKIGGTSSYYNANGLDLEIGGNLVNNNTNASSGLSVGGFQTQSLTQTTSFLGSADQTITCTSSNRINFANLEIETASTHTTFLSSGKCTIIVNGDLTLTSGTLNDGGNSIYLMNNVDNNAIHASPNATGGGMIFSGTSNQGMTGSGNGIFGNIEINNNGHGVNMTDNSTVNGQIKFTNGYLYIDDYALTLGANATIAGTVNASKLILLNGVASDKGVTKIFQTGASSFTFPIGANGKYTPALYSFSANNNSNAAIKVIPVDGLHPSVNPDSVSNYLDYYWDVSTTGFSSAYSVTHTYTYNIADTVGSPGHIERYDNSTSTWSTVTGTISPPAFTFTSSSILDGSYTIGDVFASLPLLYSIMSGSWYNSSLWSTDTTTKLPYGKIPDGNPVIIRAQDSVALSANNANAASVAIYGVLDAENTTFHNIGQVSGNGKIRISSTASGFFAFPGGTYDVFLSNPASTVEFYGSINGRLPLDPGNTTKPYQNVIFSGPSIKYISSVDTKVVGNLIIQNGSRLDNTQYNKDIYILGNWIDNSANGFAPGTGSVYFSDSTVAQRIIMGADSMTETFYNFAINNSSGVTISAGNVAVSNKLILTSGNITTSSSHNLTITNTDTSAVTGGGVNSFVNGPLKKQIITGSRFQFPVGDAASSSRNRFGYVSVSNTSTSGTQMWTVQFFDKNPTTDGYNISNVTSPLKSVVYNEYWKISGPAGGTANVTLSWDQNTGMNSSLTTRALSMVAEWGTPVANSWNSAGNVVSDFGQDSGTVGTSGLLNLGGTQVFTIGASAPAIAALITSIQTGMWNNPNVWNVGRVPGPNDTVVISSPYSVALNVSSSISGFAISNGGTYNDSTFTLAVTGNVTLDGTWIGSGKLTLTTSGDTLYGTGTATGTSTLEIAGGSESIASSANLILKVVSILSGDTLNNNGSVTIDSLTGAAAASIFNNLPGSTLIINGSLLSAGTLNAGTCPNTVIYNGSAAQAIKPTTYCNIIISGSGAKTVKSGSTMISDGSLELRSGPVLTIESGAAVTTAGTGKIILDTSSSYINLSSSAPMLQAQTRITGQDGWRMVAAPDTVTVGSMFGGKFVTQGFSGSTYPALQPNLLWWDETSRGTSLQAWRQPSSSSDTVKLGRGYMYYVFNGTQITGQTGLGNYSDTLPLTLSALGSEHPLTTAFDFGVTATTRSPGNSTDTTYVDTNAADYGWNLVGNPTPSTINWNAPSGWTMTNMDSVIYVWDPNDTTGGYKTWNGTTGNLGSGLIGPFQAFWVKANGANPSLKCDNGVKSTGGSLLGKIAKGSTGGTLSKKLTKSANGGSLTENVTNDSASSPPVLSLTLTADEFQAQAYLMFDEKGKLSYNPHDAFSLVPLSSKYLILYTVTGIGQLPMQIQDLPDTGFSEPFTIPLYLGGTVNGQPLSGSFTLSWKLSGKLPADWNISLMDDDDAKGYSMASEGILPFQYSTPADLVPSSSSFFEKKSGINSDQRSITALPWPVVHAVPSAKLSKTASAPRFRIVISTHNDMTGYLPSTPELAQNYPNPFNPTTNIAFSVPEKSRVTIEVFNVLGQRVAMVADQEFSAGSHVVVWNPRNAASGVYFCRMIAGGHKKTIKMVLMR